MVVRIQVGFHSTRSALWWVRVMLHGLILVIESSEMLQCLLCLRDRAHSSQYHVEKQKKKGESDSYGSVVDIPDLATRPQRGERRTRREERRTERHMG